jgi:hypothetical protein
MNDAPLVLSLNLLLWVYLAHRFFSALAKRKVTDGASLQAWGVIFGCYLIAALTVDGVRTQLDSTFVGLPVSTLVRSLLMLATIHVYFLGMRRIHVYPQGVQCWFPRGNVAAALVILGMFAWFAATRRITIEDVSLQIKGIRDGVVVLWLLVILFPAALHLWHQEQVRPMKLHRLTDLLFFGALFGQCVSEIAWSLARYHAPSFASVLFAVERASTYLCLTLFLVMLLPLRWFMPLFYPVRLLLYWRLQRLEDAVSQHSDRPSSVGSVAMRLTHPDELEVAIYQKVIAILDRYPTLSDGELKARIQQVVERRPSLPEIARQLAAIR